MLTCRNKKNRNCCCTLSGDLDWGTIMQPLSFIIILLIDTHKIESHVNPSFVLMLSCVHQEWW